jgi:hypothetical protein
MDSPLNLSTIANVMALGDLHDLQKGNRALTMLLQLPNFSGGPTTLRFDRWIKLFDNIVAMSNWTDDETVNMLITKLTGPAHDMLQNILDSVTKDYQEIKKLLHERFHGNENQDYFQAQLEEIERQPGENIIAYGFRLKNIFEHGYPKNKQPTKAEEATRLQMLRQKFLSGLDLKLKNKVRYKEFKDYEELVRETDKYTRRLEAEKEEGSKREFVNAITTAKASSDSQLIWTAIEKQNETINAITTGSRMNLQANEIIGPPIVVDDINQQVAVALSNLLRTAQLPPLQGNTRSQLAPTIEQSAQRQPAGYQQRPESAFYQQRPQGQFYQPRQPGPYYQPRQAYPAFQNQFRPPAQLRPIQSTQDYRSQPRPPLSSITCYLCGNKGHYRNECWQREVVYPQAPAVADERQRMLTCYTCGTAGHRSTTCPNKGANIPGPGLRQGNA